MLHHKTAQSLHRGFQSRSDPVFGVSRNQINWNQIKLPLVHYLHEDNFIIDCYGTVNCSSLSMFERAISGRPMSAVGSPDSMLSTSEMPNPSALALPAQSYAGSRRR